MRVKVVIVGNAGVGKTSFLSTFANKVYPSITLPYAIDGYMTQIAVFGRQFNVGFWDTAGQKSYDQLRPLVYPQTDIFLLCYDISDRSRFNELEKRWKPELSRHCPGIPIIVLGLKSDLRKSDLNGNCISVDEGIDMSVKLEAYSHVDCSSLLGLGVDEAVHEAMVVHLAHTGKLKHKQRCTLM
mmetsp:Transcript_19844/g.22083  ORF Transcript_19844/g.22083 Transcript_19844/m.22083 type:complete len:184 (+) Transcript_19844:91-642(+)